jgi:Fe-S cluster assembly iron-binding protein IscA
MLTVTDAALDHLHTALSRVETLEAACFRMTVSGENTLGLVVQEPEDGDRTFECKGDTVLATPEPLLDLLAERVLDLDDDGQLVLVPKAA